VLGRHAPRMRRELRAGGSEPRCNLLGDPGGPQERVSAYEREERKEMEEDLPAAERRYSGRLREIREKRKVRGAVIAQGDLDQLLEIRCAPAERFVRASEVWRLEGEGERCWQATGLHLREGHAHCVLQSALADVASCGHVESRPHEFSCLEGQHRARPAPIAAVYLIQLVLVRREEHRVWGPRVLRRDLIEGRQENIPHAEQLDRLDRTA